MKKILVSIPLILVVMLIALGAYVKTALPNVGPAPDLTVEVTPERVARGKYLANHVAVCMDCHSTRDWTKFAAPIVPGTVGKGGERFDQTMGFPGVYYSRNITPAGVKDWTDGELFRVITTGVSRDGRPMFPVMPYPYYGKMDEEDIISIIAYLRTLEEIPNEIPNSQSDFPMSFIAHTIPQTANLAKKPSSNNALAYGAYVTNAAACIECHTPVDKGQIILEKSFQGGREFQMPDGSFLYSANITPDVATGIGSVSKQAFITLFRTKGAMSVNPLDSGEPNTIMPWGMYAGMNDQDLGAIYDYLLAQKPANNLVVRFKASKD